MKKLILLSLLITGVVVVQAQTDKSSDKSTTKQTKGEKIKEAIKNLPEDLIKQPDAVADTNANKLINDNLSFVVHPLWKEQGTTSIIEYKLQKCDVAPLSATFPLPDKKLVQEVKMNMNTIKKSAADKKQMVLADIQKHLAAFYKEAGKTVSKDELTAQANGMIISSEPFTTAQGRTGDIYFMHDIQTQQTNFITLLLLPGTNPGTVTFVQLNYLHYVYETSYPDDIMEWRLFVYPDDQQTYIDFTKKMLKTLVIK